MYRLPGVHGFVHEFTGKKKRQNEGPYSHFMSQFGTIYEKLLVQLASTQEYIDGQFTGNLGEVLIR